MRHHRYTDLCQEERPLYKAVNFGVQTLSTAELIALVLNRGAGTTESLSQARQLLNTNGGSIRRLASRRLEELQVVQGIGDSKASALMAAIELGRRYTREDMPSPDLGTATRLYNHMRQHFEGKGVEEFWAVYLNQNYKLIRAQRISVGGLTEVAVDIRIIMRDAVLCNATIVAVCHNHPSGNLRPSRQDDSLTQTLRKACDTMRLHLLDHVIMTDGHYYSYHEEGRL